MKVMFHRLLLITLALSSAGWAQDRFNTPYPRNVYFTVWGNGGGGFPTYSGGTWFENNAKFDMMMITGARDGIYVARKMREINPEQILLTHYVPMFINDPVDYFLYRSYRAQLKRAIVPGQKEIYVTKTAGSNAGLPAGDFTLAYLVIDDDVIRVGTIVNDTTFRIYADPSTSEGINSAHSAGAMVRSPLRASGPGIYPNLSEYGPTVDGKKAWQYLSDKFFERHIWEERLLDGIFFDFYAEELWITDMTIDFDMNGVDDSAEHGRAWINERWAYGRNLWLQLLREGMNSRAPGSPNMILINNGGPLHSGYDLAEGHIFEGFLYWGGNTFSNYANYFVPDYLAWMAQGRKPSIMAMQDFIPEKWVNDGKERFWKMRFGLATSCIYEMYYGMAYTIYFRVPFWYDEMVADLGYPVDNQIITLANGLVLRYFSKGVAVCNPTGQKQTLSAGQLNGGPFYRMKGGQDPTFNSGEQFTSVELFGVIYNDNDWRGDGILLFRQPTTVVADIIVDNFDINATSPASNPIEFTGAWNPKLSKGSVDISLLNPYYVHDTSASAGDCYGYHATAAGNGEASAIWRPTIGVAGWYEVSEWHGWHGDYQSTAAEGTNVPFEIFSDGVSKIQGTINQQTNIGTWNRLGYVQMSKGTTSYVRITNKSNGIVIADAMRFHYMGDNYNPNNTPPSPPTNVRIQQIK